MSIQGRSRRRSSPQQTWSSAVTAARPLHLVIVDAGHHGGCSPTAMFSLHDSRFSIYVVLILLLLLLDLFDLWVCPTYSQSYTYNYDIIWFKFPVPPTLSLMLHIILRINKATEQQLVAYNVFKQNKSQHTQWLFLVAHIWYRHRLTHTQNVCEENKCSAPNPKDCYLYNVCMVCY